MLRFQVPNMSCGGCAKSVTRAVQSVSAGAKVDADLSVREISVSGTSDEAGILDALKRAGYQAMGRSAKAA